MKIRKVRYDKKVPGKIECHCVAFLTKSDHVILVKSDGDWPFFNVGDAVRSANNIMKGKKKSTIVVPFPGVISWETTTYDERLVGMAQNGELINAIVIENVPESLEELQHFAGEALRETST